MLKASPRKNAFSAVLTVDGASGSGKTTLLRGLAQRYGCAAIELGVVVRGIAWYAQRHRCTVPDATAALALLDSRRELSVMNWTGSAPPAASRLAIGPTHLESALFSPSLAPTLAAAANDAEAVAWAGALVRERVRGRCAVVSGRQAAALIPSGLQLLLHAEVATRARRKRAYFAEQGAPWTWVDDAPLLGERRGEIAIDTTHLTPGETLSRVAPAVERELGWRPRQAELDPTLTLRRRSPLTLPGSSSTPVPFGRLLPRLEAS